MEENLEKSKKDVTTLQNKKLSQIVLRPVGTIKNKIKKPFLSAEDDGIKMKGDLDDVRRNIRKMHKEVSEIIINEELIETIEDIEKYSHITILYWANKVPEKSRLLTKVHPMGRKENPNVGIFSTCSPARPNPILVTVVKLHKREKNILYVSGLDAVNGSPVIDIKPFVKEFYPQDEIRIPEWMAKIIEENQE